MRQHGLKARSKSDTPSSNRKPNKDPVLKPVNLSDFYPGVHKGSKAVERLAFSIRADSGQQLELVQPPPPPQLEFGLETPAEHQELVQAFAERYGLNDQQKTAVEKYCTERGEAYVREKAAIVDQEPRENAARTFLDPRNASAPTTRTKTR
jgi:hypothetical protein